MKPFFSFALAVTGFSASSQVAISPSASTPHASAALDVQHTNKGVLIPRIPLVSATSSTPVTAPAQGLLIYNTADTIADGSLTVTPARGFYTWTGSRWDAVASNTATGSVPRGAILSFETKQARPGYDYLGYEFSDFSEFIGTGFGAWASTPAAPTSYPAQHSQSAWYNGNLFVWSGQDATYASYANVGAYYTTATNTWTSMPTLNAPIGRFDAAVATDPVNGWMLVWGGITGFTGAGDIPTVTATGGYFDLLFPANGWYVLPASPLSARAGHAGVWTGTGMLVWGGNSNSTTHFADGAFFNWSTNSWTMLPAAPLAARRGHGAVWTGSRMIVWGGTNGTTIFNDGAAYDPATNTWTSIAANTVSLPTHSHSVVWTGTEMIVFGGVTSFGTTATGARYNPTTNTWASLPTPPGGSATSATSVDHLAVWTGTEMVIAGGYNSIAGGLELVRAYNPSTNTWQLYNPLPEPRRGAVGAWTGTNLLIHGGNSSGGTSIQGELDGYIFNPSGGTPQDIHASKSILRYLYRRK